MKGPERVETSRLVLRRPHQRDAEMIFARYSADPKVTRFLSWRTHRLIDETRAFLEFSDAEWQRWPMGPYLIESREGGRLLGGTGFAFETPLRAATGYVLAKDAWGAGYAPEALRRIVILVSEFGLRRLYALCHPDHPASSRALEKCEFIREGLLPRHSAFPNLQADDPGDVVCYARVFE